MADVTKTIKFNIVPEKTVEETPTTEDTSFGKNLAKGFGDTIAPLFKEISKNFGETFGETVGIAFGNIAIAFVDTLKKGWKEIEDLYGFSTLSNATTRDLAFTYGFNSAQAYGYTQAMNMLGYRSEEDLMYGLTTNEFEREKFNEIMTKYTDKYNELYDSGFFEEYMDFQIEWKEFKQDFLLDMCKLFIENKDTIIGGMKAILWVADGIMQIVNILVDLLNLSNTPRTTSDRIGAVSDIINQYGGNTSKSMNVTIDNTFNNVAQSDQTWLANAGQMTYEQVINALKVTY